MDHNQTVEAPTADKMIGELFDEGSLIAEALLSSGSAGIERTKVVENEATVGAEPDEPALPQPDDQDESGRFPPAPVMPGEFKLRLDALKVGKYHPRGEYDLDNGVGRSLLHAALQPEMLAPISVMKVGSSWYVVDGWARVVALRHQHGVDAHILVRVIEWTGTEKDALLVRFGQTFLTLGSRKIEIAHQLRQVASIWGVPQAVLAARIGWTDSKITKHLMAAEADEHHPDFKRLLEKADNPPIEYLYQVAKALKESREDDAKHPRRLPENGKVAALVDKLGSLLGEEQRYDVNGALAALGLRNPAPVEADVELPFEQRHDPVSALSLDDAQILEPVMGHDDQLIGALEVHADGQSRILLPPNIVGMTVHEREAARAAFYALIDRLFA